MPYATGVANNATDLRTAVVTLATANGWTWDAAAEILYKAPCYCKFTIVAVTSLRARVGLSYTGTALNAPTPTVDVGFASGWSSNGNTALNYPATYHIFLGANPDSIHVAVNYSSVWWQHLNFGTLEPLGGVTPIYNWGTFGNNASPGVGVAVSSDATVGPGGGFTSGAPFWQAYNSTGTENSWVYSGLDGAGFIPTAINGNQIGRAFGNHYASPFLPSQPNAWNGEATLFRLQVDHYRTGGTFTYIGEMSHHRMLRNDNLDDGQIVTIGSEKWFTMPVYRKNAAARAASTYLDPNHSGTLGIAVRYDGP